MAIDENLTALHGMPVRDYLPGQGLPDAGVVAWRVRSEPGGPPFLDGRLRPFLAEPDAWRVRALAIGAWSDDPSVDSGHLVPEMTGQADRLPALRALFLGDITRTEGALSGIGHGDVTALAQAFPALEEYGVRGGSGAITVGPFSSPVLRRLTFESAGLPGPVVRTVGVSDLPNLDHLELWLGTLECGGDATVADLGPILDRDRFPALRRLGLRNSLNADEVAVALATAPLVRQLDILDLSLGTLGDEGAQALLRGQSLSHLSLLDLHHHYLSHEGMAYARASGLNVDLSDQQVMTDGERSVAAGE